MRVPEKLLCIRFGVSRTPIREALKLLGEEGVVDLLPNRGAMVAILTSNDIEDMFPVKGNWRPWPVSWPVETSPRRKSLKSGSCILKWFLSTRTRDYVTYFKVNQEMHGRICKYPPAKPGALRLGAPQRGPIPKL